MLSKAAAHALISVSVAHIYMFALFFLIMGHESLKRLFINKIVFF